MMRKALGYPAAGSRPGADRLAFPPPSRTIRSLSWQVVPVDRAGCCDRRARSRWWTRSATGRCWRTS